jgi:hypothetical protein
VERKNDLGVAVGAEARPFRDQLVAERTEVVDLAVERDVVAPVLRLHRHRSRRGEVEDGEPIVGQRDLPVLRHPEPGAVRAPWCLMLARAQHLVAVDRR